MVLEAFVTSQTEDWNMLGAEPASAGPIQIRSFSQRYLAIKTSGFSSLGPHHKKHGQHQLKSPFRIDLAWTLAVDTFSHSPVVVPTDLNQHRYFCSEKGKVQNSSLGNKPVKRDYDPLCFPRSLCQWPWIQWLGVADAALSTTLLPNLYSTLPCTKIKTHSHPHTPASPVVLYWQRKILSIYLGILNTRQCGQHG